MHRRKWEARGERSLWASVAMVAIMDALAGRDPEWIGSRDFHLVMFFAGLDGDAVADRLRPGKFPGGSLDQNFRPLIVS